MTSVSTGRFKSEKGPYADMAGQNTKVNKPNCFEKRVIPSQEAQHP